jgi:hypothetical protein
MMRRCGEAGKKRRGDTETGDREMKRPARYTSSSIEFFWQGIKVKGGIE